MSRLTNRGTNGEIWITDNDETRRLGRKESAYKKLAEYEDLEEQGLLFRLPCKVRTTVFWVYDCRMIREIIVYGYRIEHDKLVMLDYSGIRFGTVGVDVFLTREEAEEALAQMKGE